MTFQFPDRRLAHGRHPGTSMIVRPASELTVTPIEWLWTGYLAIGCIAILDGDPDLGKSLITIDLASRLTKGQAWPDGQQVLRPESVAFLCDEDGQNVVVPRLHICGADMSRVFVWPKLESLPS